MRHAQQSESKLRINVQYSEYKHTTNIKIHV